VNITDFNYTATVPAYLWVVSPWGDPTPANWRPNTLPLLLAQAAGYGGA